ncbi:hypothetical protein MKX03_029919, partial [Papaver bracteatum]
LQLIEGDEETITVIRRKEPSTWVEDLIYEDENDWRRPIILDLKKAPGERILSWKTLKTYTLLGGSLYFIASGGALCRCLGHVEAEAKLQEIHQLTCGHNLSVALHRIIQRAGFYWPDMIRQATKLQDTCEGCQAAPQYQEVCVANESDGDWRTPYLDYLSKRILPEDKNLALKIEKKSKRFFVVEGELFRRRFNQRALRCLGHAESLRAMEISHD